MKSSPEKIQRNFGFSLAEILIAMGLVAIIGAGLAAVMSSAAKQQKGIQAKDQQRDVTSELRGLLANQTACANTFAAVGNKPQDGFTVDSIKDNATGGGAVKFSINTTDKTGLLTFRKFEVNNWQPDAGSTNQGKADFKVYLSKVAGTGTATDIFPDTITLRVIRNGSGDLTNCFYVGTQSDSLWQVAANFNDIYYTNGKVGIGTPSPSSALQVSGDITSSGIIRNTVTGSNNGNLQITFTQNIMKTDQSCGATTLSGLADGGTYSLLYNGTVTGTCSFTHAGFTVVLPQGHTAIPAGQRALYTFIGIGTEIFVTNITY